MKKKIKMGMLTDFFIAYPQEVEATDLHDFPIGSMVCSKGVDTIGLDILVRLLTGIPFEDFLTPVKPDYSILQYSDTGEPQRESMLTFLHLYHEKNELEELGLKQFEQMDDGDLMEWIFGGPSIALFHLTFVKCLAFNPSEQLRAIALQWCHEWANTLDNEEGILYDLLKELSTLAKQAISEEKSMYYYCCL